MTKLVESLKIYWNTYRGNTDNQSSKMYIEFKISKPNKINTNWQSFARMMHKIATVNEPSVIIAWNGIAQLRLCILVNHTCKYRVCYISHIVCARRLQHIYLIMLLFGFIVVGLYSKLLYE